MDKLIVWMADTRLAHFMGDWVWAWGWAEALHFIGMALLFGTVLVMDLRLMGFFRKYLSIHAVHALTPWALFAFGINLFTGICFFVKDAERYVDNQAFRFKMSIILLAGVNFLVFWFKIRKDSRPWKDDENPSLSGKLVGATSLLLWTLVIWGGRMIPVYGPG